MFIKVTPLEQNGMPAIRRIPVNVGQICLILPTHNPTHSLLAMAGGMQLPVNHTESDLMAMIEEAQSAAAV